MRRTCLSLSLLLAMLACAAASDESALESNRQRLAAWRADPARHARLVEDLKAFYALPAERQAQLRGIDEKLHAGDAAKQARLWSALERYAGWLERQPEETRKAVAEAADARSRLSLLRSLREKDFVEGLPKRERDELAKLADKVEWTKELREDERRRRAGGKPLPLRVRVFIREHLMPALPASERSALAREESKGEAQLKKVKELAEQHLLLRKLPKAPASFADLPKGMKSRLKEADKAALRKTRSWLAFALELEKACRRERMEPPPLGACKPDHWPAATRDFIVKELTPSLNEEEAGKLRKAQGHWPEYPRLLAELAKGKNKLIPGVMVPEAREGG
ncbi:MAG: hypothetical protein K2W96_10950 [Gemmataceae bacterium]|nr:hypothetical protein [Gemmataceae bacterium]